MKKTPSGSAAPKYKKYIYYDELSFLAPTVENEIDESLNETIHSTSLPSPLANIDNTSDSMVSSENTQDSDIHINAASFFQTLNRVTRMPMVLIQHHHKNLGWKREKKGPQNKPRKFSI